MQEELLPKNNFIIALSTVMWREIWKYGPRGWRYTQLDVGHAIGSLIIACKITDYEVKVLDAKQIPNANQILGFNQARDSTCVNDTREGEKAEVFLLLTPKDKNNNENTLKQKYENMLQILKELSKKEEPIVSGQPNIVFINAKDPVIWPYIDYIEKATNFLLPLNNNSNLPYSTEKTTNDSIQIFSDIDKLCKSVRIRRSVLDFREENISILQFVNCIASILPEFNPMVSQTCQNFQDIFEISRYYPNIHFGLWISGVSGLENGLYLLIRGTSNEFISQINEELKLEETPRSLIQVKNKSIHHDINLFYVKPEERNNETIRKEASDFSCFQSIAKDCSVVISMLAPVNQSIDLCPVNYSYLHWEAGFLGQMLYIQAYEQGIGATGMGCFLDGETANVFKVSSLLTPIYHFAFGQQVKDIRFSSME